MPGLHWDIQRKTSPVLRACKLHHWSALFKQLQFFWHSYVAGAMPGPATRWHEKSRALPATEVLNHQRIGQGRLLRIMLFRSQPLEQPPEQDADWLACGMPAMSAARSSLDRASISLLSKNLCKPSMAGGDKQYAARELRHDQQMAPNPTAAPCMLHMKSWQVAVWQSASSPGKIEFLCGLCR